MIIINLDDQDHFDDLDDADQDVDEDDDQDVDVDDDRIAEAKRLLEIIIKKIKIT